VLLDERSQAEAFLGRDGVAEASHPGPQFLLPLPELLHARNAQRSDVEEEAEPSASDRVPSPGRSSAATWTAFARASSRGWPSATRRPTWMPARYAAGGASLRSTPWATSRASLSTCPSSLGVSGPSPRWSARRSIHFSA